jgi:hypothetical protein
MNVPQTQQEMDQIAKRGTDLYETRIRRVVEDGNLNRFLAIDIDSSDYAVADMGYEAAMEVKRKHPKARIWLIRIGHIAAASFGGDTRERR